MYKIPDVVIHILTALVFSSEQQRVENLVKPPYELNE